MQKKITKKEAQALVAKLVAREREDKIRILKQMTMDNYDEADRVKMQGK